MTTKYTRTQLLISIGIWLVTISLSSSAYSQDANDSVPQPLAIGNNSSPILLLEHAELTSNTTEKLNLCKQAIYNLPADVEEHLAFNSFKKAGIILYNAEHYKIAKTYLHRALEYQRVISDPEGIADVKNYLGWIASKNQEFNQAIKHFESALGILITSNNQKKIANTYNNLGAMYWHKRNYAAALEHFNHTLSIAEKLNNSTLLRKAMTNKGVVLNNLAQYNEALICLEKALELYQLDNDQNGKAALLNNIGSINLELQQYKSCINYFTDALKIYKTLNDQQCISVCYNNLGEVYCKLGDCKKALENYHVSLNINIKANNGPKIAMSYVNIGYAHQKNNNYKKAIEFYEKALSTLLDDDDPALKALTYLRLGQTLMIINKYPEAKTYLTKAEALSTSLKGKSTLCKCYVSLAKWHKHNKEYKIALNYKTKYADLKDEITDQQALANSARMDAIYSLLHKEEQISILRQDNLNKSESLESAQKTRIIYIITLVGLLIIVLILILNFRIKRKSAALLTEKNKELKQLNATKDKFFSIIAHDLKSPFSSLMGFAEMLTLNAENKNGKEVVEYAQIIHNSTKRLLGLVENLLQWSRTQIGTTEFNPSQIDITIQTHNIVSLLSLTAEEKDIVISSKLERNLIAWADENLYNTVLRNLISNAIKFSRVGSVIYVTAKVKNNMIIVAVADSGVGIRQENLEKLFMVDSTFSTNGTFNEKGTGLGLVLCKEFVELNKGTIWAKSELEKGSTFYFTLPLLAVNEKEIS